MPEDRRSGKNGITQVLKRKDGALILCLPPLEAGNPIKQSNQAKKDVKSEPWGPNLKGPI